MVLNLPDGSNPSEVVDPAGRPTAEIREKASGETVWTAESGEANYYMDLTDTDDHIDLTSHSLEVSPGQSVGFWYQLEQLGTADHAYGPGIMSPDGGAWNSHLNFRNDSGTEPATSGTHNVHVNGDKTNEEYVSSEDWTYDLDANPWGLFVMVLGDPSGVTFYNDAVELGNRDNDSSSGVGFALGDIGYGYAGSTDAGSGGKSFDDFAVFDRELTASEISDWYDTGELPSSPLHHWDFQNPDSPGTATDVAGSADGTVNGGTFVQGGVP